ncbi:MAG: N-acetylmuramoyl-L-alanine amidase [Micavibrio sp.]|nr:N-acetylmuramoyl-L-alanine amidase [Micavibrio sp.]
MLDPGHGGADPGARISDGLYEKDVTLALAYRLRSLLQARGFTVVLTRDSDAATNGSSSSQLTLDDRAGIANHQRAVACLLLHATGVGEGVHLYRSELTPAPYEAATLPWLTAQSAWVAQSQVLATRLSQSITRSGLPLVSSAASVRPVDSLTCPALVVELAPQTVGDPDTDSDGRYQQQAAEAITAALVFWRNDMKAPQRADEASAAAPGSASIPSASAVKP